MLEVGSSGDNVRKVQQRLIQYGYLDGDGRRQIRRGDPRRGDRSFQRRNGLTVDGRVGPDTAAALGVTLSAPPVSSSASSSATIISADHRLLAKLVYAEARGESYKGQVAVAAVVLEPRGERLLSQHHQRRDLPERRLLLRHQRLDQQHARLSLPSARRWTPSTAGTPPAAASTTTIPARPTTSWIRTRTVKTVIGNHYFAV